MEFFTVEEVAKILKVSTRTVIQLIYDKKIRASKVGNLWRVEKVDLETYLKGTENIDRAVYNDYFKQGK